MSDPWFEVYRVAPGVFAIYEPHQAEEVISYLIVGAKQAALFDTGMGISDIQKVTAELTALPIVVLNSHTHHDHVGGNWQFKDVLGMDTAFTRASAQGTTAGAQDELGPDMICGELPRGFDARSYATRPWTITRWIHDGDHLDLGDRVLEILATPGHTPDAICLLDRQHGLLFTGDTITPRPSGCFDPKPISMRTPRPSSDSPRSLRISGRSWARTTCRSHRPRSCPGWSAPSTTFGRGGFNPRGKEARTHTAWARYRSCCAQRLPDR